MAKKKFNWKEKLTEANYAKKLFWFMRKSFFWEQFGKKAKKKKFVVKEKDNN